MTLLYFRWALLLIGLAMKNITYFLAVLFVYLNLFHCLEILLNPITNYEVTEVWWRCAKINNKKKQKKTRKNLVDLWPLWTQVHLDAGTTREKWKAFVMTDWGRPLTPLFCIATDLISKGRCAATDGFFFNFSPFSFIFLRRGGCFFLILFLILF